jgi:molecular chaperone GrpE
LFSDTKPEEKKNTSHEETPEGVYEAARQEKVAELEILKQSLEEQKKEAASHYDQLLRLKAEFDNFRRRTEKEKQNHILWGKEEVLIKQLNLLDLLEHAAKSARTTNNIESIQKGLDLITQELVRMLSGEGVSEIKGVGERFDPNVHEAVEQVDSDQPEGTIVDVLQKGYSLGGRMIRPARVKVAKKPENSTTPSNA